MLHGTFRELLDLSRLIRPPSAFTQLKDMAELPAPIQHSESGMIISGLAYDPDTGKWTRGRNVMIRQIE